MTFCDGLISWLADRRVPWLTALLQFWSWVGEIEGYVLVITLIYVAFDKALAVRLCVIALVAMTLNHVMKIVLANPRPFVSSGDYESKWAVSSENARELAREYSTPSGHAMAAAATYGYLAGVRPRPLLVAAAIATIFLTGVARPYLGVHFAEDILLGWATGGALAWAALRCAAAAGALWSRMTFLVRGVCCVVASLAVWVVTLALSGWTVRGQPDAFVAYLGLLSGVGLGHPLELRLVDFDPRSSSWTARLTRWLLCIGMGAACSLGLEALFAALAEEGDALSYALYYLRYACAGFAIIFVGPFLFIRLGLANRRAAAGLNSACHKRRDPARS